MGTLYLTEQGAKIRKASQRLVIEKENTKLLEVPLFQIDRILIFGAVQVSTQAIHLLLDNGIDVGFLSLNGKLRGRLVSTDSKNIFLRLAQHDRAKDESFKLRIARSFIESKIKNQRTILYRYQRNHSEVDFSKEIETLNHGLKELPLKKTVPSLMGIEGSTTGAYYRCFSRMLTGTLTFQKRTRHPPLDPVNALLSLGYVLLTNEIAALVESAGFDPFIGFLHGFRYGRQSLPLDLVEEFRHPVVDTLILKLLNLGSFKVEDFYRAEAGAYFLQKDALKRYVRGYEEQLNGTHTRHGKCFRQFLKTQVENLEKAVLNKKEYVPFLSWEQE